MKNISVFLFLFLSLFLNAQTIPLYVGTYTGSDSEGIYTYDFNYKTGELSNKNLIVKIENPSFITLSSNKKKLFSVSENGENSLIRSYELDKNKSYKFINEVSSNGANPCHIQLNKQNTKIVVSNYTGGTISIYNVLKNGSLSKNSQVIDHNIITKKSHAHSAQFYKNDLFVADLGRDFLAHYSNKNDSYNLNNYYLMEEKAGPRHFEISKKGRFIYVLNELNSTISVLKKFDETYSNIQNIGTLNDNYNGGNACADIHLSKNEKFLYASNRGENSIAVFKINSKNGELQKIQNIAVQGDWPRNFTIAPNGKFLLVANQRSKNISVFKVDKKNGELAFLYSIDAPTPVCLVF